jgi:hypothetical protein
MIEIIIISNQPLIIVMTRNTYFIFYWGSDVRVQICCSDYVRVKFISKISNSCEASKTRLCKPLENLRKIESLLGNSATIW